jgi:hypothetical protein
VPITIIVREVRAELQKRQLRNPALPFLSALPSLVRILMFQPIGVVVADSTRVGVADRQALTVEMMGFLHQAVQLNPDLVVCPEYSCPWTALVQGIEQGIFPAPGRLWALACESASLMELAQIVQKITPHVTVVFNDAQLNSGGNFVDPLCYLFRTQRVDGTEAKVVLVQTKTCAMGGHPFEAQFLITGQFIYRFKNDDAPSNSLVSLICSDVLHANFSSEVLPKLQNNTLVLHPQMNDSPETEVFRSYRRKCCTIAPRSAEILCLNWARDTQILDQGQPKPFILDPKSAFFRDTQQLIADDVRVTENHAKGCYLTHWQECRTAAFVFSPDPHLFYLETSKPYVTGPAQNAIRYGPRMLELFSWDTPSQAFHPAAANDRFESRWIGDNPPLQGLLEPLLSRHLDAERLIQLSTGHAKDMEWPHWKTLPSFRLADDDTARRLTLCWSTQGVGGEFRQHCLSRFLGFNVLIGDPTKFSERLAAFRSGTFEVAFRAEVLARRFRNLHHLDGKISATAVYLGESPGKDTLNEVKARTRAALQQTESDGELMAIWYRDAHGVLHDFMDEDVPQYNTDPGANPVGITSETA